MTKNERAMVTDLTATMETVLHEAARVTSHAVAQGVVIGTALSLLREHCGISPGEVRERAVALAEATGGDLAACIPQIYVVLPDEDAPAPLPN